MTILDRSCKIKLPESKSSGYIKKIIDISNFFPVINRSECSEEDFKLWFHSYFALIVISYRTHANPYPGGNYMLKVDNRNTRARCEICPKCAKLTIKTPERPHWRRFSVFIVNF